MKKLIVIDLDGTALHDEHDLNPSSKQALIAAKNAGHTVVIATGRSLRDSLHYYKELELDTPIINVNGAYLHHPTNENFTEIVEHLSIDLISDIMDSEIGDYLLNVVCEYKDHLYILKKDEDFALWMYAQNCDSLTSGDLASAPFSHCTRFILKILPGKESHVQDFLIRKYPDQFSFYQWSLGDQLVFELSKGGINKGTAIAHLADQLGFLPEDIIVFGDGTNDIEMLTFAGTGVAMANAHHQLLAIANATTLANTEGGIAHYLNEHVLKKI